VEEMKEPSKDWQCPPFTASAQDRMGWIGEQVSEGENWIKGQAAFNDIPTAITLISGKGDCRDNQTRSSLTTNHAKFAVRKIIAALADVREVALYASDAKYFENQVAMMNKVSRAVYLESYFPQSLKRCLQHMAIGGSGYIWPKFQRSNYGYGEGRFVFDDMSVLEVVPTQIPANNDIQEAYAVTCIVYMPVAMAHAKFPAFQSGLLPISRRRYHSTVSTRRLDLAERFRYGDAQNNWDNLYCELRYTFIHDMTINPYGEPVPMGDPDSSWFYEVPFVGQDIPDGVSAGGVRNTRKATPEDCLIYPRLRLMISSKGMDGPLYDGPPFDWHGQVPPVRYCADEWPFEGLGYALTHDIHTIERARQRLERGVDQIAQARLDPSMGYDRNAGINDATALALDPFEPRKRLGVDGDPTASFKPLLPDELLQVPGWVETFITYLLERADNQLGLNDIGNLAALKANVAAGGDVMDKGLEFVGPIVKDIAAGMEMSTARIGEQLKWMIPQYLTTRRIMQIVGPEGLTKETLDFDPESLIPSHTPQEHMYMEQDTLFPQDSVFSKLERARMFAKNLRLLMIPHTLHQLTQMQEQLKYLQLYRGGAPIAFCDVAKKLDISDYGDVEGATGFQRWVNEQKIMLMLKAAAGQLAQALAPQLPGQAQQPGTGPKGGQRGTGGRPPSGGKPPQLKQKGGPSGPRTSVVESR
jgi:hypothetical protein